MNTQKPSEENTASTDTTNKAGSDSKHDESNTKDPSKDHFIFADLAHKVDPSSMLDFMSKLSHVIRGDAINDTKAAGTTSATNTVDKSGTNGKSTTGSQSATNGSTTPNTVDKSGTNSKSAKGANSVANTATPNTVSKSSVNGSGNSTTVSTTGANNAMPNTISNSGNVVTADNNGNNVASVALPQTGNDDRDVALATMGGVIMTSLAALGIRKKLI